MGRKQATSLNLNLPWVENTKTRTCSHLRRGPQRDEITNKEPEYILEPHLSASQNNTPLCVYLWRWSGSGEFLLFTH